MCMSTFGVDQGHGHQLVATSGSAASRSAGKPTPRMHPLVTGDGYYQGEIVS